MLSLVMPAIGSIQYFMGVRGYFWVNSNMRLIWYSIWFPMYGLQRTLNLYGAVSFTTWNSSRQMFYRAVNSSRCSRRYSTSITTITIKIIFITMAFVYESDRALEKYSLSLAPPPGTYCLSNEYRPKDNYAPFYTTTIRSSLNNTTVVPGPGTYELRRNIGQPTITTYANKSSIVIRVNSEGSAAFTSQLPRFQSIISPGPGPGDYELIQGHREQPKRRIPVNKKLVMPQKNVPSIIAKTTYLNRRRAKTQEAIRSLKDLEKGQKQSKESVWARDKVSRFTKDVVNEVGPGRYTVDCRKKGVQHRGFSVGFASKTVRTFFDTIMYNTSNERTLYSRVQKGYKDLMPGPGSYYDHKPRQNDSDKYKNHSFGSSNDRFHRIKPEVFDVPFYSVSQPRRRVKTDPQFRSQVKRSIVVPIEEEMPGPGSYDPYCYKIGKILKVEIGNFGFKAQRRTILQPQGNNQIGPGSYEPTLQKISETLPSSNFSSQVPRLTASEKEGDIVRDYDICQSDISRKVLLNRIHRQNLQKINCTKPAFDTKIPRFGHYQLHKTQEGKATGKQLYLSFVEKREKHRSRGIQQARNQVPSKKATISKSRRFETERPGPGVGDYSLRDKWLKKSYNIKYNSKNP